MNRPGKHWDWSLENPITVAELIARHETETTEEDEKVPA